MTCANCGRPLFDGGNSQFCEACIERNNEYKIARIRERRGYSDNDDTFAARILKDRSRGYA